MHEKHLYEYAVIRYVPRVEREEFINVGLIMMCKKSKWLRVETHVDTTRLGLMKAPHDPNTIMDHLRLFTSVGMAQPNSGPMGKMEAEERFRWLSAVKSSCIQTSRPHPGLTEDLNLEFKRLFEELVL